VLKNCRKKKEAVIAQALLLEQVIIVIPYSPAISNVVVYSYLKKICGLLRHSETELSIILLRKA